MSFQTYMTHVSGGRPLRNLLPHDENGRFDPFSTFREEGPVEYAGPLTLEPDEPPKHGSQTLHYVVSGARARHDSFGYGGVIRAGGLEWVTDTNAAAVLATSEPMQHADGPLHAFVVALRLPPHVEPLPPRLQAFDREQLPVSHVRGAWVRVLAGRVGELRAPGVGVRSTLIAHVRLEARADVAFPLEREATTLVYAMRGTAQLGPQPVAAGELAIAREPRSYVALAAQGDGFEALVLSAVPVGGLAVREAYARAPRLAPAASRG